MCKFEEKITIMLKDCFFLSFQKGGTKRKLLRLD